MNSLGLEGRKPPANVDADLLLQLCISKAYETGNHELRDRIGQGRLTTGELQSYVGEAGDLCEDDVATFPERIAEYIGPLLILEGEGDTE